MRRAACLALAAALAACADGPPAEPSPAVDAPLGSAIAPPPDAEPAQATRPETLRDTIQVEGTAEPVTLRLVTVEGVPLPFSTYVRDGWEHDVLASGEGTAVMFTAGDGLVSVFVPAEAGAESDVLPLAEAVAASRGDARPLAALPAWAASGYAFASDTEAGRVLVGRHNETWFQVLVAYSIESADGFAPGADVVLDRLRWADTGTGLSP